MNEIETVIAPLDQSGADIFWQGAADESSIARVEELLGFKLPLSLRSFLLRYGGGGIVGEEISGIESNNPELRSRGTLLGDTFRCRTENGLPAFLAVIYYTDAGICWCIDCSNHDATGECPVMSYSLKLRRTDGQIAISFLEFLKEYVALRASG